MKMVKGDKVVDAKDDTEMQASLRSFGYVQESERPKEKPAAPPESNKPKSRQ